MTHRYRLFILPALLLAGCSTTPAQTQSSTEREIAALEKHAATPGAANPPPSAAEPVVAPAPVAETEPLQKLLSPQFESAARAARDSLDEFAGVDSEAAFDQSLASARARVMNARSNVRTRSDAAGALVLTMLLVHQKSLTLLELMQRRTSSMADDPELEKSLRTCRHELNAWIEGSRRDEPALERGACLTSAAAAAAILGQPQ